METLLKQIEDAYVANVPVALKRPSRGQPLAAVFIPYFAWDAGPVDHAEHGQQMYLLRESYFKSIGDDPEELSYAFSWPQICEEDTQPIGNAQLSILLLKWYTYQNEHDEDVGESTLLRQIGAAVTSSCRRINAKQWPLDNFTSDFVVFSQCMADETTEYGIAASVPPDWLANKKSLGMFQSWLT